MDQIKIGAFLKTLRKEKNLTQEQAAEQLGVSNRTVSRWETGTNMPDISLLLEIAELYGVSIPEAQRQGKQLAEAIPVSDRFGRCRCSCAWNLVSGFIDRRIKHGR